MEIDYKDFLKLDIRVGLVKDCEKVQKSKFLYKLLVDCGEEKLRQIITGISNFYTAEELINKKIVVLINLKTRIIMGLESNGMLLAADYNNEPFLLKIDEREGKKVPPGIKIK
ncbi:MAG: hypothetical protein ACFFC1_22355 [Promethearchaeota archaeon]